MVPSGEDTCWTHAAPGAPRAFVLGGARAEPVREAEDRPDESRHHLKIMFFHEFQMKNYDLSHSTDFTVTV